MRHPRRSRARAASLRSSARSPSRNRRLRRPAPPHGRAAARTTREISPASPAIFTALTTATGTRFPRTRTASCSRPISVAFATWLKGELDAHRGKAVRYVVYSHSHFDHGRGRPAFATTRPSSLTKNMLRTWTGATRRSETLVDRNNNGVHRSRRDRDPTNTRPASAA